MGVALVTGANRNIGAAVAKRLARDGFAVAVNHPGGDAAQEASDVVSAITGAGGRAVGVEADVSDPAAVERMVAEARDAFGDPDVLVNNAAIGVARDVPWMEDDPATWDSIFRINVTGAWLCARAVAPAMIERRSGVIVNVASAAPLIGLTSNLPYVASKGAMFAMTRSLARELGPLGIRVNAVRPGAIDTPQQREAYGEATPPEERYDQAVRIAGDPEHIASVVSFLCSDDAAFIAGQGVVVDGGVSMP